MKKTLFKLFGDYTFLFKNPHFLKIYLAQALSKFGNQMHRFGLPWIVYDLSGSAKLMAINFSISLIPGAIFSLIGGFLADKKNRKNILIIGDFLACFFCLILIFIYYKSALEVWHLFVLTFLLSSINAFYLPTFEALLPNIVKREDIVQANSLFSITTSFINLSGPILAGIVIGFIGPFYNIGINALSFFISFVLILFLPYSKLSYQKKTEPQYSGWRNSLKYIRTQDWLLYGTVLMCGVFLGGGSIGSLIQFYLRDNLGLSGQMIGISFALFEFLPLLIIGFAAPKLSKIYSYESLMFVGSIVYSVSFIGLGATTFYPLFIIVSMLMNASLVLMLISWNTLKQQKVPNNLLGRVSGTILTVQSITFPLGGAISSLLVNYISPRQVFITFGCIVLFCSLSILLTPFPILNKKDRNRRKNII
ncbi:MFS transporter [Bacillus badius]|uniref:MFS transporter n=1 Tax=Bacillus badius TaxID=1455 RepID=UPI002E1D41E9|nr:MFS transporter [Bacillus badius]